MESKNIWIAKNLKTKTHFHQPQRVCAETTIHVHIHEMLRDIATHLKGREPEHVFFWLKE